MSDRPPAEVLASIITTRRMVRRFGTRPIPRETVDRLLDLARRSPSAGHAQGLRWIVLEGQKQTERFWSSTFARETPDATSAAREEFRWQGLFMAPVVVVVCADPTAYLFRYQEPDKAASGLGRSLDAWPVPHWLTDAAMGVQNLLLAVTAEGLGSLYFGVFRGEDQLRTSLEIPEHIQILGAVAIGHPEPDESGRSSDRPRLPLSEVVHRGTWGSTR